MGCDPPRPPHTYIVTSPFLHVHGEVWEVEFGELPFEKSHVCVNVPSTMRLF